MLHRYMCFKFWDLNVAATEWALAMGGASDRVIGSASLEEMKTAAQSKVFCFSNTAES